MTVMPTELGRKYSTRWRGKPPHMLSPDIPVWYRFLSKYGAYFNALYYDCLLGGPILTEQDKTDPMKRMERALICKRADAIAELDDDVWIIEVSASPGMRALGQLVTYKTLWLEDVKIKKPVRMILVAEQIDPDVSRSYKPYDIILYLC